jgi:hypothetical protein
VDGNSNLGSDSNGISGGGHTTTISGKSITDGSGWYGSYGSLLFKSNANYTGYARQYLLTNAENSTDFSIIRSVDSTTTPTLGTSGAVTSGRKSLTLANNGDISFYEDLGVTAKFFWDASAEALGLGTATPSAKLDIFDSTTGNAELAGIKLVNYDYGVGETGQAISIEGGVRNDGGGISPLGKIVFGKDADYSSADNRDGNIKFYTNLSNSVAERLRIDSSGTVILSTLGSALQWNNGYQTITGDAAANDLTYRTYANHIFKTVTGAGSTTDGTERMRIDLSGHAIIPAGVTLGTAAGVYAAANTLDSYEEGTWTPTIDFDGSSVGITYNQQYGRYTKVGQLVNAYCYVYMSSKGSSVGSAYVSGLPFPSVNTIAHYSPVVVWAAQLSFSGYLQAYVPYADTQINLQELTVGGVNSNLSNTDFQNNTEFMFNVSYTTSS